MLEDIIRKYVMLGHRSNTKGWFPVLCAVCNDHGKKGMRAGFRFEDGSIGYNCFNCGHVASYHPNQSEPLSKDMVTLLRAFNVPNPEWEHINLEILKNKDTNKTIIDDHRKEIKIEPDEIPLKPFFVKLNEVDVNDKWRIIAEDYLTNERGIDPNSYPFYLSFKPEDEIRWKEWKDWYGRLIIPVYKDNKLIYYAGRDLTNTRTKKYLSPPFSKENVMYGYDAIYEQTNAPLYVVEGFFDAKIINGVAIFGNNITEAMLFHLRRSKREKVIIPDRYGDGFMTGLQAIKEGWSISTPEIGNCKDINEAVVKYGKMYVIKTLAEQTHSGFAAETHLRIFCEDFNNTGRG